MSVRIKFNNAGFQELLTSAGANALVQEHAEQIAAKANSVPSTTAPAVTQPYYEIEDGSDGKRARRRVRTTGERAARHEAKTQALQKALGGGGALGISAAASPSHPASTTKSGTKRRRWTADELNLLYGHGLSNAEIASRTGRTEAAVAAQRGKNR